MGRSVDLASHDEVSILGVRSLIYHRRDGTLVAVAVDMAPSFSTGAPQELFDTSGWLYGDERTGYDVTPDGQRFVIPEPLESSTSTIRVVQNWYEEFRERER